MKSALVLVAAVGLAACGKTAPLRPAAGAALPVAPYGARTTPTTTDLLTPSTEARPARSDELLRRSQVRTSDEFDLPPE